MVTAVADEFAAFARWLVTDRPGVVPRIAQLRNGFEGWIKVEWLMWLTAHRTPPLTLHHDVGVEYSLALDGTADGMDRHTKRCDIWMRNAGDHFHYVELKAPFCNTNAGKVLISAGNDLWYMSRIRQSYERAASGSAIVLGVGFAEHSSWVDAVHRVQRQAGLPEDMTAATHGTLGEAVQWCALTKVYPNGS